jgi:uncharacterized protein
MSLSTAEKIMDFFFKFTPMDEKIYIGFFGGEPLLEFDLVRKITKAIQNHKSFDPNRVIIQIVTNGTIFSKEIADFLRENNVTLGISCDGPPFVHDVFRKFPDGSGSSRIVERNLKQALKIFPFIPVNAVYSPNNVQFLPEVVDYLSSLGVRNIHLNHNISAKWTKKEAEMLPNIYNSIGNKYMNFYRQGKPRYISLIDGKIAVILRGGYQPLERCRLGMGEFAFAPSGDVYPCERLIGSGVEKRHCMGNINDGFSPKKICKMGSNIANNLECQKCGLQEYCMNGCGCTNYHSTGNYNIVGPFVCASEKAAICTAFRIIQNMRDEELNFSDHLAGTPLMSIIGEVIRE